MNYIRHLVYVYVHKTSYTVGDFFFLLHDAYDDCEVGYRIETSVIFRVYRFETSNVKKTAESVEPICDVRVGTRDTYLQTIHS